MRRSISVLSGLPIRQVELALRTKLVVASREPGMPIPTVYLVPCGSWALLQGYSADFETG